MATTRTLREHDDMTAQQRAAESAAPVAVEEAQPPQQAYRPETRREHVRLEALRPNPWQPRATVDAAYVRELAESIVLHGMLQRPLARAMEGGEYEIAFGHMRIEAVRLLAGEGRWPWPTVEVDVRAMSDREMAVIALSENTKRKDLTPLETYRAWRKALEIAGMTQTSLAHELGIERPTLSNALRVLALPQVVLDRVDAGDLSIHAAREFLCLQAEDHTHEEIMQAVIASIAGTRYGDGQDWRAPNVRRLIREHIGGTLTGVWRHLASQPQTGMGVHGGYAAEFDADAFVKAFPSRVHTIPHDEPQARGKGLVERGQAWTCDAKEWRKWQDRVKATAQREMPGVRVTKADEDLRAALRRDPVARKAMAVDVSGGTIAQRVVESRAPKEAEPGNQAEVQAEAVKDEAAGYRLLTARLGLLVQGLRPGTLAWGGLHTVDMAERLVRELSLAGYGLDVDMVRVAIGRYAKGIEDEVARETAAEAQDRGGLTAEARRALGTRGQPVLDLGKTKAWYRRLTQSASQGIPVYFPDVKECTDRCTTGALYGKEPYNGEVRLVCTNEECFARKLEAGKAALRLQVQAARDQMEARDRPVVAALEERLDAAGASAVALALLAGGTWRRIRPANEDEFAFDPPPLAWAMAALGVAPAKKAQWEAFSQSDMRLALEARPGAATTVAACLVVHAIGQRSEEELRAVAARLGVTPAQPAEPAPKGKRGKAAKAQAAEEEGEDDAA